MSNEIVIVSESDKPVKCPYRGTEYRNNGQSWFAGGRTYCDSKNCSGPQETVSTISEHSLNVLRRAFGIQEAAEKILTICPLEYEG